MDRKKLIAIGQNLVANIRDNEECIDGKWRMKREVTTQALTYQAGIEQGIAEVIAAQLGEPVSEILKELDDPPVIERGPSPPDLPYEDMPYDGDDDWRPDCRLTDDEFLGGFDR